MFIVIDGPDGTTLAQNVVKTISQDYNLSVEYTCEPTSSDLGKEIRKFLKEGGISKERLLSLFLLDREEHLNNFVIPSSQKGSIVICDRYKYSTICYQHLQGFSLDELINLNAGFLSPDFIFLTNLNLAFDS